MSKCNRRRHPVGVYGSWHVCYSKQVTVLLIILPPTDLLTYALAACIIYACKRAGSGVIDALPAGFLAEYGLTTQFCLLCHVGGRNMCQCSNCWPLWGHRRKTVSEKDFLDAVDKVGILLYRNAISTSKFSLDDAAALIV